MGFLSPLSSIAMTTTQTAPQIKQATKPETTGAAQGLYPSKRIYNFSAGPAVMPEEVLRQAQQDIWNIFGSGIGIMEHSHRGPVFDRVIDEAKADCRKIANISDEYEVLFLQGGATTQFAMIPMNLLSPETTADYPDTGVWTTKAIKEAKLFGKVNVAFEGSKVGYTLRTPSDAEKSSRSPSAVYLHYCSNNTIYGTRYNAAPPSHEFATDRAMPVRRFSAGPLTSIQARADLRRRAEESWSVRRVVLVIIRKDFMERQGQEESAKHVQLCENHAKNDSRLNTPASVRHLRDGPGRSSGFSSNGGLPALEQTQRREGQAHLRRY